MIISTRPAGANPMIINSSNVTKFNLSECQHMVICITGITKRRGSSNGINCSGFNINKELKDGMTVQAYQDMIKQRFDPADPQFSLTKHLRYDIQKGYLELRERK